MIDTWPLNVVWLEERELRCRCKTLTQLCREIHGSQRMEGRPWEHRGRMGSRMRWL